MSFVSFLFLLMAMLVLFLFNTKMFYLRALLILEALMLTALMISILVLGNLQYEPFMFLLLLTFAVSEAGLGLSLLLTYMKNIGSDLVKSYVI
uniref:NADH dehydrogenase subunit 4L n=1 Tax=Luchuphaedusa nesiothauma TaxID=1885733 RepID=A0A224A2K9_9EUPU|nr:NADH dehydrogenase subunit 4L [Luchuphaedusa nesiothauma]